MPSLRYAPILLTKRGERSALRDTNDGHKDAMLPVFVVHPVPWDYDNDLPAATIDNHLKQLGQALAQSWRRPGRTGIDLIHIDDPARMSNGSHALSWLIDEARASGLNAIPVVSSSRTSDYVAAAAAAIRRHGGGAVIRLQVDEWPSGVTHTPLTSLMSALGVNPPEIDLILDLGGAPASAGQLALQLLRTELMSLPHATQWRTVIAAGTAMPALTSHLPKGLSQIERTEWTNYQKVLQQHAALPRVPMFGDYAISSPDPGGEVDPKLMSIGASLRYAIADHWIIAKGGLFKGRGGTGLGGAAMVPLASDLAASPHFAGASDCDGCSWIIAASSGTGGNPEAWRKAGTTHHLTRVSSDLSSLFAALGLP